MDASCWLRADELTVVDLERCPRLLSDASAILWTVSITLELSRRACIERIDDQVATSRRLPIPSWHHVDKALVQDDSCRVRRLRWQRCDVEPDIIVCIVALARLCDL